MLWQQQGEKKKKKQLRISSHGNKFEVATKEE